MTTTANLAVNKISVSQGSKEVTANEAFDVFDAALSELAHVMTDANYTLLTTTTPQEWQYGILVFTGALTAGRNIIVPTNKKEYTVYNNTTGGFALTVKTSAGTGVAVVSGATAILRCDGTNVVGVTAGAGAGDVMGPASATNNNYAVFDGVTGKLIKDGGAFPTQPFDVHVFYPGLPTASAKVLRIPVARAVTFPDEFAGSYGKASVAATASTAFDVQKNGASVGTITFAAAASTATFVTSGTTVVLAAGDVLSIIAPATPDATLADPGFVLAGTR